MYAAVQPLIDSCIVSHRRFLRTAPPLPLILNATQVLDLTSAQQEPIDILIETAAEATVCRVDPTISTLLHIIHTYVCDVRERRLADYVIISNNTVHTVQCDDIDLIAEVIRVVPTTVAVVLSQLLVTIALQRCILLPQFTFHGYVCGVNNAYIY